MNKLEEAINAIKEGNKSQGKKLLIEILQADQKNENAWLWMSVAVKDIRQRQECLEKALEINPDNQTAQKSLASLKRKEQEAQTPHSPIPSQISPSTTSTIDTRDEQPSPKETQFSKEEIELLRSKELITYELSQGASRSVLIAKYIREGFPKKAVENLINEIDGELEPATSEFSLSNLLFSTEGRITRSTYWLFSFAYFVLSIIAIVIDLLIGTFDDSTGIGLFTTILALAGAFPAIAVQVKRLHDRDRSGWFLLLGIIPFVSIWVGIELGFLQGTSGSNQYGPDPTRHNRQRSMKMYEIDEIPPTS